MLATVSAWLVRTYDAGARRRYWIWLAHRRYCDRVGVLRVREPPAPVFNRFGAYTHKRLRRWPAELARETKRMPRAVMNSRTKHHSRQPQRTKGRRDGIGRLDRRWLDEPVRSVRGKSPILARPAGLTRIRFLFGYRRCELAMKYNALVRREWFAWTAYERLRWRTRAWRRRLRVEWALREFSAGRLGRPEAIRYARCRDVYDLIVKLLERALPLPECWGAELDRQADIVARAVRGEL